MTETVEVQKETWVAPEIKTLDVVAETNRISNRGSDGCRFADSTRS